jgi:hypothetical protein
MRKSARLVSVAFSYVALIFGLFALPTVGQGAPLTVLNWIPPNSFVPPVTTPPTPPTTLDSLNTDGLLVPGSKASGTIPMWLCSTAATTHPLCSTNSFAMVGKDPSVKGTAETSIDVRIVPLRFTASPSLTFDPENNDSCSPKRTPALNMVQQSPLFKTGTWSPYLKPVGAHQFGSVFQRANFWTYTQPKALSPNYEITLAQTLANAEETTKHVIAIIDPTTTPNLTTLPYTIRGAVLADTDVPSTWCDPLAMIEVNDLDTLLQTQIIPALKGASNITPTTVPIFLLTNVVMYDSNLPVGQQCCILGYHNAYFSLTTGATAGKIQTYIVANYDSTGGTANGVLFAGAFPTAPDLAGMTNMIAGWMDNPTTLNPTPSWLGTFSGVSGCQSILEAAYPNALAGKLTAITMPNKTVYHVQDLAFKSWFYGDTGPASTGFGPLGTGTSYSLFGTLSTPNLTCP